MILRTRLFPGASATSSRAPRRSSCRHHHLASSVSSPSPVDVVDVNVDDNRRPRRERPSLAVRAGRRGAGGGVGGGSRGRACASPSLAAALSAAAAVVAVSSSPRAALSFAAGGRGGACAVGRRSGRVLPGVATAAATTAASRWSLASTPTPTLLNQRPFVSTRGGGGGGFGFGAGAEAAGSAVRPGSGTLARVGTGAGVTSFARHFAATSSLSSSSSEMPTTTEGGAIGDDAVAVAENAAQEKLRLLRSRMNELGLDAYLIPSDDPHLSEYVPDAYMRRKFLTGFGGSAGTALVTSGGAYLWTDSRYFNEASLQLDASHWTLMKMGQPNVPTIPKFLAEEALTKLEKNRKGAASGEHDDNGGAGGPYRVGLDPYVHSANFASELEGAFDKASEAWMARQRRNRSNRFDVNVVEQDDDSGSVASSSFSSEDGDSTSSMILGQIDTLDSLGNPNLIDEIWERSTSEPRPPVPKSPFRVHPMEYAGISVSDKLSDVRAAMEEKGATMTVLPSLDDVAYLFNLRSKGDIDTCPVGIAYAIVTSDSAILYCDEEKMSTDGTVRQHLSEASVTVKPYDQVVSDIEDHLSESPSNKVWIDKSRANYALCRIVPDDRLICSMNAIAPMKACKNDAEMEGMRKAHVQDGVAMAHFMAWLENEVVNEGRSVNEVEIDERLTGFRAEREGFVEVSFPTIAGVGGNGAIIHYRAQEGTDLLKHLDSKHSPAILIDSGGQYEYGTTDVTRTWHLGRPDEDGVGAPPAAYVDAYTRVLKGNIGLDSAVFPEGTPGFALDVLARTALWKAGMDYGHGTGHGVGAALNVHEGPQSISPRYANTEAIKKGMVLSNEPGYYEDGKFGIRIENLMEVVNVVDDNSDDVSEGGANEEKPKANAAGTKKKFLKFEKLTLIPIQKNLIDVSQMTEDELDWLDGYHQEVWEKISPHLEADSNGRKWLEKACAPIDRSSK